MPVPLIARKDMKYRTRRLKAGDGFEVKNEREARIFVKLKHAERANNENRKVSLDDAREKVGLKPLSPDSEDIKTVREEYERAFGKRPFNGWSIKQLKDKIAGVDEA